MTTYVSFNIVNNTRQNGNPSGFADADLYVFMTQESINTAWAISTATGVAIALAPGTLAPSLTLADLGSAGGAILVDASVQIASARIYISSSPQAVSLAGGAVSGPTAGTADFYYDFVELALTCTTPGATPSSAPNNLNIDTTQVDQLGIPITLQVTPNDPNFNAGSGIVPTLDRQTLFNNFQAMAVGPLAPFADCIFAQGSTAATPYRLLNPSDVIGGQLQAMALQGSISTGGIPGTWQASFKITGPGDPAPTNGGLTVGMPVSGPLIPAGTTISALPDYPTGNTVVMRSSATANPFTASAGALQLYFLTPAQTALATYFDQAIDALFAWCLANPGKLQVEQNNGNNHIYSGSVVAVSGIADINGTTSTYTVLQFTGGSNEVYNIYYPFFTTNAAAGKTTPLGAAVPPPPTWWAPKPAPASSLAYYAPPSQMVFGASGVFADNTQQQPYMASGSSSTVLGAIENVVVTALARGYATTWQFLQGSITPNTPPTTAQVNLAAGYTTAGLVDQMDMASFQIANVPMTVSLAAGAPTSSLAVSSPLNILPTVSDLLTFSQFYPAGATWSAFAQYLHNPTVTIGGRAYALPFDDQGGFSSDLNSTTSTALPASASITLGPWAAAGHVQPSAIANTITLTWPASDDYTFIYVLSYSASGAYVCTSVEISAAHSYFNGNTYVLPTAQQTPASVPRSRQESITMYVVPLTGVYSAAVWCHIDVPGFVFEGNAFEFSNQYDGAPPLTIW